MGAPVARFSFMAPPTWSMWACVMMICFTVSPCRPTMASTSSIWSPGSMTRASRLSSSPTTQQLPCRGPTGRISWIMTSSCAGLLRLWRRRGLRRLALRRRWIHLLQHGAGLSLACHDGEQDGSEHEDDGSAGGGPGQYGGRAPRPEGGLAAAAAEGGSDVRALAALQQHHDDQEHTNDDVHYGQKNKHARYRAPFWISLRCDGAEGGI